MTGRNIRGRSIHTLHRILKAIIGGENKPTNIWNASRLAHGAFNEYVRRLEGAGLIAVRPLTEEEHWKDRRGRRLIEVTEEGKRLLRDLEALDRRCGGLLLER